MCVGLWGKKYFEKDSLMYYAPFAWIWSIVWIKLIEASTCSQVLFQYLKYTVLLDISSSILDSALRFLKFSIVVFQHSYMGKVDEIVKIKLKQDEDKEAARLHSFKFVT